MGPLTLLDVLASRSTAAPGRIGPAGTTSLGTDRAAQFAAATFSVQLLTRPISLGMLLLATEAPRSLLGPRRRTA